MNSDQATRQRNLLRQIRNEGPCVASAKIGREVQSWDVLDKPPQHADSRDDRIIGQLQTGLSNAYRGGLEALSGDILAIHYSIFGDTGRDVMYGANTNSIMFKMEWKTTPVVVSTYVGTGQSLIATSGLVQAINDKKINRKKLADYSNWPLEQAKNLTDDQQTNLLTLFRQASGNHSRLLRLVKGCLLYLSVCRKAHVQVQKTINSIVYSLSEVLSANRLSNVGFIYSSSPQSDKHSVVLETMCRSFPPSWLGYEKRVSIPADGENYQIVAYGGMCSGSVDVVLRPSDVWSSLCIYAADMGISDDIEKALIIACSLEQNRYFSNVKLPVTVSYGDLIRPMFVDRDADRRARPHLTADMGASLGKIHQMMCFGLLKDLISVGFYTTRDTPNWEQFALTHLNSRPNQLSIMAKAYGPQFATVSICSELKLIEGLTTSDVEQIMGTPILEALWLFDRSKVATKKGTIYGMRRGSQDIDGINYLDDELDLAAIDRDSIPNPPGDFTITGACIEGPNVAVPPAKRWRVIKCANPSVQARTVRKLPRRREYASSSPSVSTVEAIEPAVEQIQPVKRSWTGMEPPESPMTEPAKEESVDSSSKGQQVEAEDAEEPSIIVKRPSFGEATPAKIEKAMASTKNKGKEPIRSPWYREVAGSGPSVKFADQQRAKGDERDDLPIKERLAISRESFKRKTQQVDNANLALRNKILKRFKVNNKEKDFLDKAMKGIESDMQYVETFDELLKKLSRRELKDLPDEPIESLRPEFKYTIAYMVYKNSPVVTDEMVRALADQLDTQKYRELRKQADSLSDSEEEQEDKQVPEEEIREIASEAGALLTTSVADRTMRDVIVMARQNLGSKQAAVNAAKWLANISIAPQRIDKINWEDRPFDESNRIQRKRHDSGRNYMSRPDDGKLLQLGICTGVAVMSPNDYRMIRDEFEMGKDLGTADVVFLTAA